ncbi:MAG: hypothetical protein IJX24_03240 [Oscillospiraceae bacterium]|nr:hypothetical protein [Oscillospiraceae bacterium]
MELLEKVKNNERLKAFFYQYCDFDPYEKLTDTNDLNGEMKFNIANKAFGMAGDGSEFLILDDGTIALNGSEGYTGRIADSMKDFFALLLNFPCFWDFMVHNIYLEENKELFRNKLAESMSELAADSDFEILKVEAANELGIQLDNDVVDNTAARFYNCATREQRFGYWFEDVFNDELFLDNCFWC